MRNNDELVFTSSAILDLLSQIEELNNYDIDLTETTAGLKITIGNSVYNISSASEVEVDADVLDDISEINEAGFDELSDLGVDIDTVESGLVKEIAKTLAIGGLVRLTKKLLS